MSEIIIDLSNYRETSSARVEEGIYNVVVEDAEIQKSRAGNNMIVLYFRINEPGTDEDGKMLIDRLTQSEKAMFRTVSFLQAIGIPFKKKKFKLNLNMFLGKHLRVRVEDGEPYNGNVRSEVRDHYKVGKKNEQELNEIDAPEFESEDTSDELDSVESGDDSIEEVAPEVISLDDLEL